jgi:subtilisin family serine protease
VNDETQNAVTDERYADLIVDLTKMDGIKLDNRSPFLQKINEQFAVLQIPVEEITPDIMQKYGYSAMPKCYGITTYRNEIIEYSYIVQKFGLEDIKGSGVLIGILDTGIDYLNPAFINVGGTTKIRALWDQTIDNIGKEPVGFLYGSEYTAEDINIALHTQNPLETLPSRDDVGEGTAMAAIAAGNQSESSAFTGIVSSAELAVVKLKPAKKYLTEFYGIPEKAICYQQNDIMMGIKYLLQKAEQLGRPIIIGLGLSSSQGAHDGRDIMSLYLEECGKRNNVGIAVAVGNEGNQELHYYGLKQGDESTSIAELNVSEGDPNFTMELWTNIQSTLSVTVLTPEGDTFYRVDSSLPPSRNEVVRYENMRLYVDLFTNETYSQKKLIVFRFQNIREGIWRFLIEEPEGVISFCHIWLPIRNFLSNDTYFLNSNQNTTISVPGNADQIVTVTSYDAITNTLAPSAGRGYTFENNPKPDIAAPGVNIIVPILDGGFYPLSGSGLAVAFTAGIMAAIMEGGTIINPTQVVNTQLFRLILTYLARRSTDLEYPNPDWGYGYIV